MAAPADAVAKAVRWLSGLIDAATPHFCGHTACHRMREVLQAILSPSSCQSRSAASVARPACQLLRHWLTCTLSQQAHSLDGSSQLCPTCQPVRHLMLSAVPPSLALTEGASPEALIKSYVGDGAKSAPGGTDTPHQAAQEGRVVSFAQLLILALRFPHAGLDQGKEDAVLAQLRTCHRLWLHILDHAEAEIEAMLARLDEDPADDDLDYGHASVVPAPAVAPTPLPECPVPGCLAARVVLGHIMTCKGAGGSCALCSGVAATFAGQQQELAASGDPGPATGAPQNAPLPVIEDHLQELDTALASLELSK